MTVKQLKKMLEQHPDDMEVLTSRYSDYCIVDEEDWSLLEAVPRDGYVMQTHPTMSNLNKSLVRKYLHLKGN